MNHPPTPKKPHIVFYFSDTGGGHRSAAEAIIEAVHLMYGERVTTEMVDFFKDYAPPPFNRLGDMYPYMVKAPRLWGASFHATDGRAQARVITTTLWPLARPAARALVREHPADLIVTVHPFAKSFALRALGKNRPPFINVVTDTVTTHALWYDKRADLILVPTETARQCALKYNMPEEKVRVVGLPIADRYCIPLGRKSALRKKLGWVTDKPVILLVGGGEGMGPLAETADAIDESGLDVALVIVCGRNRKLKERLEAEAWENPVFIYGFTRDMPDFMRASDLASLRVCSRPSMAMVILRSSLSALTRMMFLPILSTMPMLQTKLSLIFWFMRTMKRQGRWYGVEPFSVVMRCWITWLVENFCGGD